MPFISAANIPQGGGRIHPIHTYFQRCHTLSWSVLSYGFGPNCQISRYGIVASSHLHPFCDISSISLMKALMMCPPFPCWLTFHRSHQLFWRQRNASSLRHSHCKVFCVLPSLCPTAVYHPHVIALPLQPFHPPSPMMCLLWWVGIMTTPTDGRAQGRPSAEVLGCAPFHCLGPMPLIHFKYFQTSEPLHSARQMSEQTSQGT